MEYGKIIAVTGMPGLFELLNSKNDGAIVRSLDDKSTKFVSSRVHNFSHLESIEVFTVRDNVNLVEIFNAMEKEGGKVPDGKDAAVLKKYFEKVYGDLDFERVYNSDLKKMAKWFEILKNNKIEIKLTEQPEKEVEEVVAEVAEEKPAKKKAAPAKETAEKETKTTTAGKKSAPAKTEEKEQPAAKKKAEPAKEKSSEKSAKASADKEEKAPAKKAAAKKAAPKKK
ncbi:MAG: DUF5606 domain-containing protein [Chitinophagaceae bacterium]|nr:DUF5606 domain-containing protein [Chitinophagaceae bacterium]